MPSANRGIPADAIFAQRQRIATSAERPWPLAAVAVGCIAGVLAGSLRP